MPADHEPAAGGPYNPIPADPVDPAGDGSVPVVASEGLHVTDSGAVATSGGTVTVLGAVAAGRDVHIGQVTVIADDGPPVGDQAGRPGAPTDRCPYPGLSAFGPDDADLFFGRDADRDAILRLIGRSGLVAVVGSSGSGKSSLLAAAVTPAASVGRAPVLQPWQVVAVRPGLEPLAALRAAIATHRRSVSDPTDAPTLWVLDQFEEIFDPAVDAAVRQSFLDLLMQLTADPNRDCVLVALRSDFYAALDLDPRLARAAAAAQHRVVPLDLGAVESAVVQPAELVGLRVEAALVTEIRQEMGANPSALPLLGYALRQTWRRRRNGWLTLAGYVEAGGIGRALQDGAQRAWGQLSPAGQDTARRLLLRLSHIDDAGTAVRRRRRVADLVTDVDDQDAVTSVVNALAAARLLTLSEDPSGHAVVEIAHESLLVEWPLLRDWLREDRDAARIRDELIQAVQAWTTHDEDPGYLLPAPRLVAVQSLRDGQRVSLTADERRFLAESGRRARRARRLRRLLPALVVLVLVASLVAALAVSAQRRADQDRRTANALQAAATARTVLPGQRDLGALLSLAAYRSHPSPTTLATLIDAVASPDGPISYSRPAPFADSLDPTLTPDGTAAVGLSNGRIELLPPGTGPPRYLTGHNDAVTAVLGFGPGLIASADASGTVLVHRPDRARPRARFVASAGPGAPVTALAADSRRGLVVAAAGRSIRRFSVADPSRRWATLTAPDLVTDVAVDPASDEIIAATQSGIVVRWQTTTGRRLPPLTNSVNALLASAAPRLAMGGRGWLAAVDGAQVYLWRGLSASHPQSTSAAAPGARSVVWTSDGGELLVGDATGTVTAWQPGTPPLQLGARYRGLAGVTQQGAAGPALASNGPRLVGLDGTGTVVRWQLGTGTSPALERIAEPAGTQQAVAWSSSGVIAAGDSDGTVILFDRADHPVRTNRTSPPVGGLVWRSSGTVVVGDGVGALDVVALPGRSAPARPLARPLGSNVVGMAPAGGDQVAELTESGVLRVVGPTGEVVSTRRFPDHAHAVAMDDAGMVAVATGDARTTVITLERRDGSDIRALHGHLLQVDSLAFSPDGRQLASGSDDRTIRLWSTSTGQLEAVLRGHTDMVTTLVYNADGTMLASGSQDGTVRLWSVPDAVEVGAPLTDAAGFVQSLSVSPDGTRVVAANGGAVDVWPFTPTGWARAACVLADRDLTAAEWTQYAPGLTRHRLCA